MSFPGLDCARKMAAKTLRQKKARYGSGLNLSLEENRGDAFIMLHRKREIQFKLLISAIGFIDGDVEIPQGHRTLGAPEKMFYDSKMVEFPELFLCLRKTLTVPGAPPARVVAMAQASSPGYHGAAAGIRRCPTPH